MSVLRRAAAPVTVTALVATIALTAWPAASATPPARKGRTETLTLPWKVSFRQHDIPPTGISSGDTIQAQYTLTGKARGTADFACTAAGTHFLCQGIIRLPQGDIYAQTGPVDEDEPAAIVGGTRQFVGTTGQFRQQENEDDTGVWTLELQR